MRSDVGPGTVVLSTQPEEVPALAYYLPRIARFVSPLGVAPDPRVVDWRNALARFTRSSVTSTLAPAIAGVAPGQRVLLVVPTTFQKAPRWMSLIHRASRSWARYLAEDPRLRLVTFSSRHAAGAGSAAAGSAGAGSAGRGVSRRGSPVRRSRPAVR